MASTLKDLLQRFTFWAAGIALVAVLVVASLAGRAATRTLERLADQRGAEVAARATALVANYVRERHAEADQLAANPSLIRAAMEAARSVVDRHLDALAPADLERMFAARRQLGTDPDLARYLRSYPERSEFTDLTVSERHGLIVTASGEPQRLQQRDDPLWQQGIRGGAADRALYNPDRPERAIVQTARGSELIVSVPAVRGRFPANEAYYWVLFREPSAVAYATARAVQRSVWFGAIVLFAFAVLMSLWLGRWLNRRVAAPMRTAGNVAARVASGDLTVAGGAVETVADEIDELQSSVQTMVVALRRLVGAIRSAADEAAAMATEISASTEEMSAATEEMSATCQDLSNRAAEQAQLVRGAADDAAKILQIATVLASGAEDSVRRNTAV